VDLDGDLPAQLADDKPEFYAIDWGTLLLENYTFRKL
jgi:hypothetical protein